MTRLRILAVSVVTVQHGIHGGMERYFDRTLKELSSLGHAVHVLTTGSVTPGRRETGVQFEGIGVPVGSRRRAWDEALRARTQELRHRPDVVLSNSFVAHSLLRLGLPVVTLIQGSGLVDLIGAWRLFVSGCGSFGSLAREVVQVMRDSYRNQRTLLRRSSRVIAVSEQTKRSLVRLYRIPEQKIAVVPAPVDTEVFHPAAVRSHSGQALRVFSAGTLTQQKGFQFVLGALAILMKSAGKSFRLAIAGEGPELANLRGLARQLGIDSQVCFLGGLAEHDMAEAYRNSDVFVLGTLREEGFPLVLAEALASGIPAIATIAGGNVSAIRPGLDGILVKPGSSEAIASALETLAADRALLANMSEAARQRAVSELDSKIVGRKIETELKAAAGKAPADGR